MPHALDTVSVHVILKYVEALQTINLFYNFGVKLKHHELSCGPEMLEGVCDMDIIFFFVLVSCQNAAFGSIHASARRATSQVLERFLLFVE